MRWPSRPKSRPFDRAKKPQTEKKSLPPRQTPWKRMPAISYVAATHLAVGPWQTGRSRTVRASQGPPLRSDRRRPKSGRRFLSQASFLCDRRCRDHHSAVRVAIVSMLYVGDSGNQNCAEVILGYQKAHRDASMRVCFRYGRQIHPAIAKPAGVRPFNHDKMIGKQCTGRLERG
jgi:hypothetical protein